MVEIIVSILVAAVAANIITRYRNKHNAKFRNRYEQKEAGKHRKE